MFRFLVRYFVLVITMFVSTGLLAQDLLVSGGNTVSTIICANGFVYTWGNNQYGCPGSCANGLLGNGAAGATVSTPTKVNFPADAYFTSLSTNITVRAVDAGSGAHFVAVDCHGGVWSWGNNAFSGGNGQTGTGSVATAVTLPARVLKGESPGGATIHASLTNYLVDVKYISGGNDNSYCIMNSGEAMGWGKNDKGQLGNGTNTNSSTPVYIKVPGGANLTGVIQIEAGDETAYALVDTDGDGIGTVYSWGAGSATFGGQCMLGRNTAGTANSGSENTNDNYARPVLDKNGNPMTNIKSISAGDILCLALDVDGYVWAWGNGGWGDCTGQGTGVGNHSDPRKVVAGEWGTTAGVGFGEIYLKAKAISGGQGFAMAVTTNGIPVAWGNNGACGTAASGGALGNGNGTNSSSPKFIRTGAAAYHSTAVSISDGDTWGFYTTWDNKIFTWGNNASGQLGLSNTTCQTYATEFTLPACTFPAPKPYANLTPRDQEVCVNNWTGTTLNCQFVISASLAADYKIDWYKDNVLVSTGSGTATTYTATAIGTYRVEVSYIGSDAPCTPYLPATDEIIISEDIAPFTANTGTYCGANGTFSVTGYAGNLTNFDWYTTYASAVKLNGASSNSFTTALTNATMINATTYRLWAQDSWALDNLAAKTKPCTSSSVETADRTITQFTAYDSYTLESVMVDLKSNGSTGNVTYKVEIYNDNAGVPGTLFASTANQVVAISPTAIVTTVPVNLAITGVSGGTKYWIKIVNVTGQFEVLYYSCNGTFPYIDDSGQNKFQVEKVRHDNNPSSAFGVLYNFNISRGQYYSCRRIPVDITENCPPCIKPNSVSFASSPINLCVGNTMTLAGIVDILGLTPQNGNYYYTWFKGASVVAAASTTYADFTIASVATTDAGTYKLRVEDGNAGSSTCYKEATIVVNVSAVATGGTVAASQTICSGTAPTAFTSSAAATNFASYQWQSSPDNVTFTDVASATSATYAPGTLTATIYYRRNAVPSVCPSVSSNVITVTVTPVITAGTISADQSICSGTAPAAFTETVATTGGPGTYTYQWQSSTTSTSSGFTNIAGATSATYTSGSLTVDTYFRRVDKASSGNCSNQNTNVITITVLPGLNPGSISGTENICYNTSPTISFANSSAASGGTSPYTYSWQISADGTTWGAAPGSTNSTSYTPTGPLTDTMFYRRVVTDASGGSCNTAYTNARQINVWGILLEGTFAPPNNNFTVCQGTTIAFSNVADPEGGNPAGFTTVWQQSTDGGATWITAAGSGSGSNYTTPGLSPGTISFRRQETNACGVVYAPNPPAVFTYTVNANNAVSVSINNPGPTCASTPMSFTATPTNGGASPSYQWYVNNAPVGTNSATYAPSSLANNDQVKVILTSNAICPTGNPATSNIVAVSVQSNVAPTVSINTVGNICADSIPVFTATPSGGGASPTYLWFRNNVSTGVTTSTYSNPAFVDGDQIRVQLTSSLSCTSTVAPYNSNTVTLNILPVPTPQIIGNDTTMCSGSSKIYTSINGGGTLTWFKNGNPLGASGNSYTASTAGIYTLKENNGACSAISAPVTVTIIPSPIANAGADIYAQEGTTVSLNGSGGSAYSWSPATGLSSTSIANPSLVAKDIITYTLTVADATNTCFDSDEVTVWVEKPIVIPNAFTPNGDNTNDGWNIENIGGFPNCDIQVFNRWGNLVYKSTGYTEQWDGTNFRNGENLPDGTYFYIIDLNSQVFTEPYSGYVQIVK